MSGSIMNNNTNAPTEHPIIIASKFVVKAKPNELPNELFI